MVCYLIVPRYYLNQCWFTVNDILWDTFQGYVYLNTQDINPLGVFEIYTSETQPYFPEDNEF